MTLTFDAFRRRVPSEVARIVEPFRSHQLALMALLAHDAAAIDLARSNPVLAYLVAQRLGCTRKRIVEARPGSLPQRGLLEMLGIPPLQSIVNILRKTQPQSVHGGNCRLLVEALSSQDDRRRKLLAHVSIVNEGVLGFVLDGRAAHVSPGLLEEAAADTSARYRSVTAARLATWLEIHTVMDQTPPERTFRTAAEVEAALAAKRAEYTAWLATAHAKAVGNEPASFPDPPIPDMPNFIEALTSPDMLYSEGSSQSNCVYGYGSQVESGKCYIYRVLWPERATLSTVPGASSDWVISELETARNQPASPKTWKFVESWLERARVGV